MNANLQIFLDDLILFEERKLDYSWWRDVGGVELWYGGD